MQHDAKNAGGWPLLGCGAGLRRQHYACVTSERPPMDWFEATTENYMDSGGRPLAVLEEVRRRYPVVLHGVSLSIGSADRLDAGYLERLKRLVDRIHPAMVSDHLSWSGVGGRALFDLLPLPFTAEALDWIVERVGRVQDFLGRRILLENVSSYVVYRHSTMPEWQFLAEVSRRSGCGILLDLNNVYVNSVNHGFDPLEYLRGVPAECVGQFHLAGHSDLGDFLFDTHSSSVVAPVWELYERALAMYGQVSTLIEWDEAVPEFPRLSEEAAKARAIYERFAGTLPRQATAAVPATGPRASSAAPPRLREAQSALKDLIVPGAAAEEAAALFDVRRGASMEKRLAAYSGGYLARVHEALAEAFEAVRHLVGDGAFQRLAASFAAGRSSADYNLNRLGREFPAFLSSDPLSAELGFLPDLARLEWAVCEAFHAFDGRAFGPADLAATDFSRPENLRVDLQPSAAIIRSPWPIVDLWEARRTPRARLDVRVEGRPQTALVHRQGLDVRCVRLTRAQADLLAALAAGEPLGDALDRLDEEAGDGAAVGEWFADWTGRGLFASVRER